MSKKYKILVSVVAVIFSVFLIIVSFFAIAKAALISEYKKTDTSEALYYLCGYYSLTSNHKKIVVFHHKLLISGSYDFKDITDSYGNERMKTKNYMLYEYMLSCIKVYSGEVFALKIAEAFPFYDFNDDMALVYMENVINDYYNNSNDKETIILLYDLLLEKSDEASLKYDIYSRKYHFIAFTLGETEKAKQDMLPELNRLYSEYQNSKFED